MKSIAAERGHWRSSGHGGTMTTDDGRVIELAGCDHPDDRQKYKGRPHDLKAFDELPDFPEDVYTFLGAWNRTTIPGQRCRKVGCGNPPSTPEGEWVIRRWAPWLDPECKDRALPGELRWYAMVRGEEVKREDGRTFVHDGELIEPWSRTFIPAKLIDNPILVATGYGKTLSALPEPLRSQLLHGDFTASRIDSPWQVIPSAWVRAAMHRWKPKAGRVTEFALSAVGVDVARGGDDRTCLSKRHRHWFAPLEKHPGSVTPDGDAVALLVEKALTEQGWPDEENATVNVDAIGVGSAVYDAIRRRGRIVRAVIFSKGTNRRDRADVLEFGNLRAYAYWSLRDALDPVHGDNLELPPDPELLADLSAPTWEPRAGGIIIESKDKLRERLGRSPDSGDAVVLAHLQLAPWEVEDERPDSGPACFGERCGVF